MIKTIIHITGNIGGFSSSSLIPWLVAAIEEFGRGFCSFSCSVSLPCRVDQFCWNLSRLAFSCFVIPVIFITSCGVQVWFSIRFCQKITPALLTAGWPFFFSLEFQVLEPYYWATCHLNQVSVMFWGLLYPSSRLFS